MKKLFYIFLVLIPFSSPAQVPGYQGKRLSIEGDFYGMSALFNPNVNLKSGLTSFNIRSQISLDYITSKNMSLGIHYGLLNTGWEKNFEQSNYDANGFYSQQQINDFYKVHSDIMGMYFKFFKSNKGAIAPNGAFQKLGISFIRSTPTYFKSNLPDRGENEPVRNAVMLTYGFGKQTIFYNRFIFKYGIETGISPTILKRTANTILGIGSSSGNLGYTLNERILCSYLININLGLGIILF